MHMGIAFETVQEVELVSFCDGMSKSGRGKINKVDQIDYRQ